jgi:hypothetical protein
MPITLFPISKGFQAEPANIGSRGRASYIIVAFIFLYVRVTFRAVLKARSSFALRSSAMPPDALPLYCAHVFLGCETWQLVQVAVMLLGHVKIGGMLVSG